MAARYCGEAPVEVEIDASGPRWILLTITDHAALEWQVHDQQIAFG